MPANEASSGSLITQYPAEGLRNPRRLITGHDASGDTVFLKTDHGDHHGIMLNGIAAQNCIYSTGSVPVDLNDNKDFDCAIQHKPGVIMPNGSLVRMIDFAPGVSSNMHRSVALVYGVVIDGEFEVSLNSGEARNMLPGDIIVNRAGMHKWRNTSSSSPGRMLFVLLDVTPVTVKGKDLEFDLGELATAYD